MNWKVFFFFLIFLVFPACPGAGADNNDITGEILKVYESGEKRLIQYLSEKTSPIAAAVVEEIAREGFEKRDINRVHAAGILSRESGNKRLQAAVALESGHCFQALSLYTEARQQYDRAALLYEELKDLPGQAKACEGIGRSNFYRGDNAAARRLYDHARKLYLASRHDADVARIDRLLGDIFLRTGAYEQARKNYESALKVYRQSRLPAEEGNTLRSMGDLYLRTRKFDQARQMYDQALPLLIKENETIGEADIYRNRGQIELRTGNIAAALKMYEKAEPLYEKMKWAIGRGNIFLGRAEIFFYAGNNDQASRLYDQAFAEYEKAEDPEGQGFVYRRRGLISMRTGDNENALDLFGKALACYVRIEDPLGQADGYKATGDVHFYTRDHAKALEMYDRALPLYAKIEEPVGQGNVYRSMGEIFYFTGDYEKSLEIYDKAMFFYRKAHSPIGEGNVYRSIGDVYYVTGRYNEALEMQKSALPLYRRANSVVGLGDAYRSLGDIHYKLKNYRAAMENYEEGLTYFKKANSTIGQGNIYQSMGDVYLARSEYERAWVMLEKALEFYTKMSDIESEAYIAFKKAAVLEKEGKNDDALKLYEEGVSKLEKIRRQAVFAELKRSYMEKVYDLYETAAVFMLERRYEDKAFLYIESMRARAFLDQLSEGRVDLAKGIDPSLKQKRDLLERNISLLARQITEESGKEPIDYERIDELKRAHAQIEDDLEAIKREIRYKNPLYSSVQYPEPISRENLQRDILKNDELILEYFLARGACYCLVVGKNRYEVIKLPVLPEILEKHVQAHLNQIQGKLKGAYYREETAVQLYTDLIGPVEKMLQENALIIVPQGILAHLPFESLMFKQAGRAIYLLEKFNIKYVQSASVLAMLRTQYKQNIPGQGFIGFGDPVYDYENFKAGKPEKGSNLKGSKTTGYGFALLPQKHYTRAGGQLERLIGSGEEVREIEKIFREGAETGTTRLRIESQEEYARTEDMGKYGYIHFSTHGILDARFQAIALSQIPGAREDGFLTLGEIMNSRYNAQLVVLSACETGLGRMDRGEGVTGLTRAVMYAGTPAAVVSLWSVSDEGTKELMVRFYKNLVIRKMSKDDALRLAKLELLGLHQSGRGQSLRSVKIVDALPDLPYSHPFFWSAFVMYGE
jgi:CHAT domain-containing protein/uncharacterized protein HemY